MTRILPILTLTALALLSFTHADAKPQSEIAACIAKAETRDAMQLCKRIVFKACVKEPDNMDSTMGLVECNDREGNEWHALLETRTAELKKRDPHRVAALKSADASWRTWLEHECYYHRSEAMGGSAEAVITTECKSDLTADRAILLTWQARGNALY